MEENNYIWLLRELASRKVVFPILETIICRGGTLLDWFTTTESGEVSSILIRTITRTKHLLNYLLSHRSLATDRYLSQEYSCYIFSLSAGKLCTSKNINSLNEIQLNRIRSVHVATSTFHYAKKIYTVSISEDQGKFDIKITFGRLSKKETQPIKNNYTEEKAANIASVINSFFPFKRIEFRMIINTDGEPQFLNLVQFEHRNLIRNMISLECNDKFIPTKGETLANLSKVRHKTVQGTKFPTLNSPSYHFMKMIAKTVDKKRKKRKNTNSYYQIGLATPEKIKQKSCKRKINSMGELLKYIEKTRPSIWRKDSCNPESVYANDNYDSIVSKIYRSRSYANSFAKNTPIKRKISVYANHSESRMKKFSPCLGYSSFK